MSTVNIRRERRMDAGNGLPSQVTRGGERGMVDDHVGKFPTAAARTWVSFVGQRRPFFLAQVKGYRSM